MNFNNLVVAQSVNGLPGADECRQGKVQGRRNRGALEFRCEGLSLVGTYAYHDARFGSFVQTNDAGEDNNVNGNLLEMSPQHLASVGLMFTPPQGFRAYAVANYVGKRFFDRDNDVAFRTTRRSTPASATHGTAGKCASTATTCRTAAIRSRRASSVPKRST